MVRDDARTGAGAAALAAWLTDVPQLRGRIGRETRDQLPAGAMGAGTDALTAVLEPGGVAVAFVGALVAWVRSRRGSHTVEVVRPDGTKILLTLPSARAMSPQEVADLAERLAGPPEGAGRASDGG